MPQQCLDLTTEQAIQTLEKIENGICSYCREIGNHCMLKVIADLLTMTVPDKVDMLSDKYRIINEARQTAFEKIEKERILAAERGCRHTNYQTLFTQEMLTASRNR